MVDREANGARGGEGGGEGLVGRGESDGGQSGEMGRHRHGCRRDGKSEVSASSPGRDGDETGFSVVSYRLVQWKRRWQHQRFEKNGSLKPISQ